MSTHELKIVCECGCDYEVEAAVEPGESNWGADADGNRGISIPPSIVPPDEAVCPHCGKDNAEQAKVLAETFEFPAAGDDYPELDEDDFDPDLPFYPERDL